MSSTSNTFQPLKLSPELDPEAPGLDEDTRARRRALQKLMQLSPEEAFQLAVRAGIFLPDGQLAPFYREDAEPYACRPDLD